MTLTISAAKPTQNIGGGFSLCTVSDLQFSLHNDGLFIGKLHQGKCQIWMNPALFALCASSAVMDPCNKA